LVEQETVNLLVAGSSPARAANFEDVMKQQSIKGRYKPKNPHKYNGNVKKITYRSLWERRFMLYCDKSDQIFKWSSEELYVPYLSPKDGEWHNYYPDFVVNTRDGRVIMVEIKPNWQKKFAINQAKWKFAEELCNKHGWEFKVMTENELF
jgi:hypothetical protein